MINRLATYLLRRHVANGPHHRAGIGVDFSRGDVGLCFVLIGGLDELGQSKVENLYSVVFSNEQIVGFQIAMNNSLLVRGRETMRDLERIFDSFALWQCNTGH